MKFATSVLTTAVMSVLYKGVLGAPSAVAKPGDVDINACDCHHNGDAGRWNDPFKPSDRLNELCSKGGGCHQSAAGRMCVSGNLGQCGCAVESAREWESWHRDWFLWSAITCGGLGVTIT